MNDCLSITAVNQKGNPPHFSLYILDRMFVMSVTLGNSSTPQKKVTKKEERKTEKRNKADKRDSFYQPYDTVKTENEGGED